MRERVDSIDEHLLLALRAPGDPADPIGPAWFESAIVDLTSLGGYAVLTLVTLLAAGFLVARKSYGRAGLVLGATIGATLLSEGLKLGIARPRPDLVAHIVDTTSMSFPSGHAMLSAVTYLTLGALLMRAQERRDLRGYIMGAAILITFLVGVSRIYLGVHWPTDVLGGWVIGGVCAFVCLRAANWIEHRSP